MNAQLAAHPGQLTAPLALSLPDLQDHLHRALAQLIGVLPLCRHDSASFQGSEPPRSPGRSKDHPRPIRQGSSGARHPDHTDNTRCRRMSAESLRWSSCRFEALAITRTPTTHVYEFQLMLYTAPWPRLMSGHAILTAGVSVSARVLLAGRLPADIQAPAMSGHPILRLTARSISSASSASSSSRCSRAWPIRSSTFTGDSRAIRSAGPGCATGPRARSSRLGLILFADRLDLLTAPSMRSWCDN